MTIGVTLEIDPTRNRTTVSIAARFEKIGARLVSWRAESNGAPALATFHFVTETARHAFVLDALETDGVSIAVDGLSGSDAERADF